MLLLQCSKSKSCAEAALPCRGKEAELDNSGKPRRLTVCTDHGNIETSTHNPNDTENTVVRDGYRPSIVEQGMSRVNFQQSQHWTAAYLPRVTTKAVIFPFVTGFRVHVWVRAWGTWLECMVGVHGWGAFLGCAWWCQTANTSGWCDHADKLLATIPK